MDLLLNILVSKLKILFRFFRALLNYHNELETSFDAAIMHNDNNNSVVS